MIKQCRFAQLSIRKPSLDYRIFLNKNISTLIFLLISFLGYHSAACTIDDGLRPFTATLREQVLDGLARAEIDGDAVTWEMKGSS